MRRCYSPGFYVEVSTYKNPKSRYRIWATFNLLDENKAHAYYYSISIKNGYRKRLVYVNIEYKITVIRKDTSNA